MIETLKHAGMTDQNTDLRVLHDSIRDTFNKTDQKQGDEDAMAPDRLGPGHAGRGAAPADCSSLEHRYLTGAK